MKKIIFFLIISLGLNSQIADIQKKWKVFGGDDGDIFSNDKEVIGIGLYSKDNPNFVGVIGLTSVNNTYAFLIALDNWYLFDDENPKVSIAFDNDKKTIKTLKGYVGKNRQLLGINDDIENLILNFKKYNNVSFKVEVFYPSYKSYRFDAKLNGFTSALNKWDSSIIPKINKVRLQKIKEQKIKDSLFAVETAELNRKKMKIDSLTSIVKDSMMIKLKRYLKEERIDIEDYKYLDIKNEIVGHLKFKVNTGMDISDVDLNSPKIYKNYNNRFYIELRNNDNRRFYKTKLIDFKYDYLDENQKSSNIFFTNNSGEYDLSFYNETLTEKKNIVEKWKLIISKDKSELINQKLKINMSLNAVVPKNIEINDSTMYFIVDESRIEKCRIKFLEENKVQIETAFYSDINEEGNFRRSRVYDIENILIK